MTNFPPLAGLCSHSTAARPGYSVADATRILHRIGYVKQRLAVMAASHLPSTPEWEVKGALALHGWLDAEHAAHIYGRIAELRELPPSPDDVPDRRLEAVMDEALAAESTAERIIGTYAIVRPDLKWALRHYIERTNVLCDQPSYRLLRLLLQEEREIEAWGREAIAAVRAGSPVTIDQANSWATHLRVYLDAAGGVSGDVRTSDDPLPPPRARRPHRPEILPRRDARFSGLFDVSTPADLVYLDETRDVAERNAALLFKRLREMDVPELIGGIVGEVWSAAREDPSLPRRPWDYYVGMLRQMWDEARHSMLGETVLEARGIDWQSLPINVTFSYKLAKYCSSMERHLLLYAIEQSLMPRAYGKLYEHRVAAASGDRLSALFHDFDWADEVLHVEMARKCLRPDLPGGLAEAKEKAKDLWDRIQAALEREPLPAEGPAPPDWWRDFARAVTGKEVPPPPESHVKDWRPPVSG
ncbi:MAG: hypothetical protein HYX76_05560 [Acidobacteria bacterium]|nr:hypothetical protein [Acidobacteriota bacterium]